jgi:hypothetical protein
LHPTEILEKLIEVQKTDSGRDDLERLKKDFLKQIAALEGAAADLKNSLAAEKKALEDLLKGRKTLEMETGALDNKITKYVGQQNEVKNNEQFLALKHEIEKAREDKGKAEEKTLEGLFHEDTQKAKIQDVTGQLAQAEKKAAEAKKELEVKIADCDKAAQEKLAERTRQVAELPDDYRDGYERLRNNGKKIAVAQVLEDQTCGGCHMNVPPQLLNEMRKGIAIQRCDCGRYLYKK